MPQDALHVLQFTVISQPVPIERALAAKDQIFLEGSESIEQLLGSRGSEVLMEFLVTVGIDETGIHLFCVQVAPDSVF